MNPEWYDSTHKIQHTTKSTRQQSTIQPKNKTKLKRLNSNNIPTSDTKVAQTYKYKGKQLLQHQNKSTAMPNNEYSKQYKHQLKAQRKYNKYSRLQPQKHQSTANRQTNKQVQQVQ